MMILPVLLASNLAHAATGGSDISGGIGDVGAGEEAPSEAPSDDFVESHIYGSICFYSEKTPRQILSTQKGRLSREDIGQIESIEPERTPTPSSRPIRRLEALPGETVPAYIDRLTDRLRGATPELASVLNARAAILQRRTKGTWPTSLRIVRITGRCARMPLNFATWRSDEYSASAGTLRLRSIPSEAAEKYGTEARAATLLYFAVIWNHLESSSIPPEGRLSRLAWATVNEIMTPGEPSPEMILELMGAIFSSPSE